MLVVVNVDNLLSTVQSALVGDFVGDSIDRAKEVLYPLYEDGFTNWVCNCSQVELLDSSSLAFFGWVDRLLTPVNGRFALVGIPTHLSRLLELSSIGALAPTLAYTLHDASVSVSRSMGDLLWDYEYNLDPDISEMGAERRRIESVLGNHAADATFIADVRIALGEALANAYSHGANNTKGADFKVRITSYSNGIIIVVSDNGGGFEGSEVAKRDHLSSGGRGLIFMRELMDVVTFEKGEHGGTIVRMVKYMNRET